MVRRGPRTFSFLGVERSQSAAGSFCEMEGGERVGDLVYSNFFTKKVLKRSKITNASGH